MYKNYLLIALRSIIRHKTHSVINIIGLSIGLSCCILIMLYIKDDLSYDRFHANAKNIYRIVEIDKRGKRTTTPAPLASVLLNEFPEVVEAVRVGGGRGDIIAYGDKEIRGNRGGSVDTSFFKVFTMPFIKGNPQTALSDVHSVVITEALAQKLFGDEEPMGKVLLIGQEGYSEEFTITGVIKNPPSNSQFRFNYVVSFMTYYRKGNEGNLGWGATNYETFILLSQNCSVSELQAKLAAVVENHFLKEEGNTTKLYVQPLTQMYLNLNPWNELPTDRDSTHIYIFSSIALLILLLACVNFINLTTAQYMTREKEVGIRKVVGAHRSQLVRQFLGESVILSLISFILSIPVIEFLLPGFNHYAGKELSIRYFSDVFFSLQILGLVIVVGLIAGGYPAFFVSGFRPVNILQRQFKSGQAKPSSLLRGILVLTQFSISIGFIACTIIMRNQMQFIQSKDLGYNKDHLVVVPIYYKEVKPKYELYKTEILRNTNIVGATAVFNLPSERGGFQNVHFKGPAEGIIRHMNWISVDYDFVKTLGLKITMGRDFSPDFSTDKRGAYIVNKSAVNRLGWKQPVGEQMQIVVDWGTVIGVIDDFHFQSLRNRIQPLALLIYPDIFKYLLVRIRPENIVNSITFIKRTWENVFPGHPFEYSFFDEDFDRMYKSEIQQSSIFSLISLLAICIACLGLVGLTSFATERRTKEIGIRKTLGASVSIIFLMLSKESIKWVFFANLIAWPLIYYAMNKWLQGFAYKISLSPLPFIVAGVIALVIALATVSFQAIKAARANPVEALRYE